MIFCKVTPELVDELRLLTHGKALIDCGAGEKQLEQKSKGVLTVVSFDLFPRDPADPPIDVSKMDFHKGHVLMFLRPDHGGWVEATIRRNKESAAFALYIGLEKNVEDDLGEFFSEAYVASEWCGTEGERIWRVDCHYGAGDAEDLEEYHLVTVHDTVGKAWVSVYNDEYYENGAGGRCPRYACDVHATAHATCLEELDWSDSYLVEPKSKHGWLDRSGRYYGCPYMAHDTYARYVLKVDVRKLEEQGWVRVTGAKKTDWTMRSDRAQRLSAEQRNWLSANGYRVYDED